MRADYVIVWKRNPSHSGEYLIEMTYASRKMKSKTKQKSKTKRKTKPKSGRKNMITMNKSKMYLSNIGEQFTVKLIYTFLNLLYIFLAIEYGLFRLFQTIYFTGS